MSSVYNNRHRITTGNVEPDVDFYWFDDCGVLNRRLYVCTGAYGPDQYEWEAFSLRDVIRWKENPEGLNFSTWVAIHDI